ncbi:MAG TPA: response regulator [Xanthobacteraceae bacterium]|jgi:CheY-like chemotaxis protein
MNSACPIGDPAYGRPTILVVEGEVLVRMALSQELRQHGFNVAEAKNTDEALSIVHAGIAVEVAVINLDTPGPQDGTRLAATLRSEYPNVKVLVASGQTAQPQLNDSVDAFVKKPYDVARLVAVIQSLLDQ